MEKDKSNINNNLRLNSLYSSTLISFIERFLLKFLFTYRYICTTKFQVNILPVNKVKTKTKHVRGRSIIAITNFNNDEGKSYTSKQFPDRNNYSQRNLSRISMEQRLLQSSGLTMLFPYI